MTDDHEFTIEWLGWNREVCATVTIRRHDLSAAITAAANMLKRGTGASRDAHGFYVKVTRWARVRNSTYKVRQLAAEGDHYTINLSDDADGCLAGAMAIYDKMRHRLVTGED